MNLRKKLSLYAEIDTEFEILDIAKKYFKDNNIISFDTTNRYLKMIEKDIKKLEKKIK